MTWLWRVLLLLALPFAAFAREGAPVVTSHATATLVSEADSVARGRDLRLAVRLRVAPGWHTYWQNPGDAGAAPTLVLRGASAGAFAYPVPERTEEAGLVSYVLRGDVLLPFVARPAAPGAVALSARADFLVCAQVCVPQSADLTLNLPAGDGAKGAEAPLFAAFDAAAPRPSPFPATVSPAGLLHVAAPGLAPRSALFLPAEPGVIDQLAPQALRVTPDGISLALKPVATLTAPLAGVLVLTDQGGERSALAVSAAPGAAAAPDAPGLARALLLAFAGGLILNLMPCVLPVLAMKAFALIRLSGAGREAVRREAAGYVAGVIVAFAAIGAAVLAAGAAGHALGWGAQFQSPVLTVLTAWLMLAIGLNLLGVFEIGGGAAGIGQRLARRGSFFTGLLAVVVATPCTAPFMAAALAATLVLPPAEGFLIFLALGAGLAAPYAALAAWPGAARLLPRPGAWMVTLRRVLAVPMLGSAVFFAWVVDQQLGEAGLLQALGGAAALILAAWMLGRAQRRGERLGRYAFALGVVLPLALLVALARVPGQAATATVVRGSEAFSPARLAELRAAHRPVLVDMSAAWCITCLVNERLALAPAHGAFARHHAVLLRGDWTREDPAITAFLHEYGRNGVPLYVFFPASGAPEVLPQVLTEAEIVERLGA